MEPPTTVCSLEDYFIPPEAVRGCKVLDRDAFNREFELPALRLAHPSHCSSFLKRLAHASLRFPTIKSVLTEPREDGKEATKVLLLAPYHLMKKPLLPEDHDWIAANGGEEVTRVVKLGYANYSKRAVLRAILPAHLKDVPVSFELVGHIAHYNLKEEHLPYKNIIGQVTLDKQPTLRTVVNKMDQIDNTFRFFKMEVLAGEEDLVTTVKENGCTFTFDFSTVYWNSRLGEEHLRVVELLGQGEVVLDVFAGVGPFAIPAAKSKACMVYANDLNPHSYQYLKQNAKKNHVCSRVKTFNLDGREFVISLTKQLLEEVFSSGSQCAYSHVIMNLPASSVQFLDAFQGLFCSVPAELRPSFNLPFIHCYCFVKTNSDSDTEDQLDCALQLVISHLGVCQLDPKTSTVQEVRSVAPNKVMMRVSFRLPPEVAYSAVGHRAAEGETVGYQAAEGKARTVSEESVGQVSGDCRESTEQPVTRHCEECEEPPAKLCKLEEGVASH